MAMPVTLVATFDWPGPEINGGLKTLSAADFFVLQWPHGWWRPIPLL
jgi:hypothetical protein